jgi:hypothetical protein
MIYALYYTSNRIEDSELYKTVQENIALSLPKNIELLSSSRTPIGFGNNRTQVFDDGYAYNKIAKAMLLWLNDMKDDDYVYFVEDDVLYNPTHFDIKHIKFEKVNFNLNCFRSTPFGFNLQNPLYIPLSCFSGPVKTMRDRIQGFLGGSSKGMEPLVVLGYIKSSSYFSDISNIDVRHCFNTSKYNPFFSGMCQNLNKWGDNQELRLRFKLDREIPSPIDVVRFSINKISDDVFSLVEYIQSNSMDLFKSLLDNAREVWFVGKNYAPLGNLVMFYDIKLQKV